MIEFYYWKGLHEFDKFNWFYCNMKRIVTYHHEKGFCNRYSYKMVPVSPVGFKWIYRSQCHDFALCLWLVCQSITQCTAFSAYLWQVFDKFCHNWPENILINNPFSFYNQSLMRRIFEVISKFNINFSRNTRKYFRQTSFHCHHFGNSVWLPSTTFNAHASVPATKNKNMGHFPLVYYYIRFPFERRLPLRKYLSPTFGNFIFATSEELLTYTAEIICDIWRLSSFSMPALLLTIPQVAESIAEWNFAESIAEWNFNWSLWGVSHLGQAKLLHCNQILGHAADQNWQLFLVMIQKSFWSLFFNVNASINLIAYVVGSVCYEMDLQIYCWELFFQWQEFKGRSFLSATMK